MMNKLPKGCYCIECRYGEPGAGEDGEPIAICHFYNDETLYMKKDDFCSIGEKGEYQEPIEN